MGGEGRRPRGEGEGQARARANRGLRAVSEHRKVSVVGGHVCSPFVPQSVGIVLLFPRLQLINVLYPRRLGQGGARSRRGRAGGALRGCSH